MFKKPVHIQNPYNLATLDVEACRTELRGSFKISKYFLYLISLSAESVS